MKKKLKPIDPDDPVPLYDVDEIRIAWIAYKAECRGVRHMRVTLGGTYFRHRSCTARQPDRFDHLAFRDPVNSLRTLLPMIAHLDGILALVTA